MRERWNFWLASGLLASTIVGVGMFGIPFAVHQSGLIAGFFYLLILGSIVLLLHLAYGEVVLRGGSQHRLIGHADYYLGAYGRMCALFATIFGLLGALLAYIIVGSTFFFILVHAVLPSATQEVCTAVFIALGALGIASSARAIVEFEFAGSVLLIIMIAALFIIGLPYVQTLSFTDISLSGIFIPYGVILFALSGRTAIEEMRETVMRSNGKRYRNAIILGTLVPVVLYALFTAAILGMSGENVSKEAFQGLQGKLGNSIIIFGALLGLFAVVTSYLAIGLNVVKTFWYDIHIPRLAAIALTIGIPLMAYLFRVTDFIWIIGIVGVVMGGIEGVLILLIHERAQRRGGETPGYCVRIPFLLRYAMMAVFILGIIHHLLTSTF